MVFGAFRWKPLTAVHRELAWISPLTVTRQEDNTTVSGRCWEHQLPVTLYRSRVRRDPEVNPLVPTTFCGSLRSTAEPDCRVPSHADKPVPSPFTWTPGPHGRAFSPGHYLIILSRCPLTIHRNIHIHMYTYLVAPSPALPLPALSTPDIASACPTWQTLQTPHQLSPSLLPMTSSEQKGPQNMAYIYMGIINRSTTCLCFGHLVRSKPASPHVLISLK